MQLGKKCTADCVNYLPPDDVQYEFITGQFQDSHEAEIKRKQIPKGLKIHPFVTLLLCHFIYLIKLAKGNLRKKNKIFKLNLIFLSFHAF